MAKTVKFKHSGNIDAKERYSSSYLQNVLCIYLILNIVLFNKNRKVSPNESYILLCMSILLLKICQYPQGG